MADTAAACPVQALDGTVQARQAAARRQVLLAALRGPGGAVSLADLAGGWSQMRRFLAIASYMTEPED